MTSNINPERPDSMRDLDGTRDNFRTVRSELEAMQSGGAGATQSRGFWFANLSADVPSGGAWVPLPPQGGGMTGDPNLATLVGDALRLEVEAVASIKLWVEFDTVGDGTDEVAIQLDGVDNRGQQQLLTGATMVQSVYDGWLASGALISAVALSEAGNTVLPSSYVTIVITPTGA